MANWQYILDLKDLWDKYRNVRDIPYSEEGKLIAARIRTVPFFKEFEDALEEIAWLFEDANDKESFDSACDELWAWGDTVQEGFTRTPSPRNCWIKTF